MLTAPPPSFDSGLATLPWMIKLNTLSWTSCTTWWTPIPNWVWRMQVQLHQKSRASVSLPCSNVRQKLKRKMGNHHLNHPRKGWRKIKRNYLKTCKYGKITPNSVIQNKIRLIVYDCVKRTHVVNYCICHFFLPYYNVINPGPSFVGLLNKYKTVFELYTHDCIYYW